MLSEDDYKIASFIFLCIYICIKVSFFYILANWLEILWKWIVMSKKIDLDKFQVIFFTGLTISPFNSMMSWSMLGVLISNLGVEWLSPALPDKDSQFASTKIVSNWQTLLQNFEILDENTKSKLDYYISCRVKAVLLDNWFSWLISTSWFKILRFFSTFFSC